MTGKTRRRLALLFRMTCWNANSSIAHAVVDVPARQVNCQKSGCLNLQTTAVYTTAAGLEARDFLARMWEREGNSGGSGA